MTATVRHNLYCVMLAALMMLWKQALVLKDLRGISTCSVSVKGLKMLPYSWSGPYTLKNATKRLLLVASSGSFPYSCSVSGRY